MASQPAIRSDEASTEERMPFHYRARLITPGSYLTGILRDLTCSGARVTLDSPPSLGTTVLLQWSREERLCTVIHSDSISCDLAFEEPWEQGAANGSELERGPSTEFESGTTPSATRKRAPHPAHYRAAQIRSSPGHWSISLPRPTGGSALDTISLGCGEEMFFYGSPLAHLVEYRALIEDESRMARRRLPPRMRDAIGSPERVRGLSDLIVRCARRLALAASSEVTPAEAAT